MGLASCGQADLTPAGATGDLASGKWTRKHLEVRAKLGISTEHQPWTRPSDSSRAPRMVGVPCNPRYYGAIDLAWASRKPKHRSFPYYVDISQCPTRAKHGEDIKCLTTSARVYDFRRDRIVCAPEAMQLQGLPAPDLQLGMFRSAALFSAVSEAMAAPSVASLLLAIYLNPLATWWSPQSESQ